MQEGLATEHSSELVRDALEQLLDGSGIANESGGHLQPTRRNVANGSLDIVRNPLDEVGRVLVLDVEHLLVDLLHGHTAAEDGSNGQVASVARVAGGHHVLRVEHLLGELGDGEGAVLLRTTGGERCETGHEEVETRERDHVDGQLPQIGVELAREAKASRDTGHG